MLLLLLLFLLLSLSMSFVVGVVDVVVVKRNAESVKSSQLESSLVLLTRSTIGSNILFNRI
jgi:hypothetical protein